MAKNTKNEAKQIADAKLAGGKSGTISANMRAIDYAYAGLNKTNIPKEEQQKFVKKILPVITMHIKASQDKTANRAAIIENRKRKQETLKAKKK